MVALVLVVAMGPVARRSRASPDPGESPSPTTTAGAGSSSTAALPGPPRDVQALKVGTRHIELSWEAPGGGLVVGYRISGRVGGDGDFKTLIKDTGETACRARVPVSPASWWELRVAAISAGGVGPDSRLTQPMMTKSKGEGGGGGGGEGGADGGERKSGRRGGRHKRGGGGTAAASPELDRRRRRSISSEEELEPLSDDDGKQAVSDEVAKSEAEYARVKLEMHRWDREFVQKNGRQPTEQEQATSPRYRRAAATYARLRGERQVADEAKRANEAWQEGLAANGVTLQERVWEVEAAITQWEFRFFRANGRKPTFLERVSDEPHAQRQEQLLQLKREETELKRVLDTVSSHALRDGLLDATTDALQRALGLFVGSETGGCGTLGLDEFSKVVSSELPRLMGQGSGLARSFAAEQLERTFLKADLNGDGRIDFNEFYVWLSGGSKEQDGWAAGGGGGGWAESTRGEEEEEGREEYNNRLLKAADNWLTKKSRRKSSAQEAGAADVDDVDAKAVVRKRREARRRAEQRHSAKVAEELTTGEAGAQLQAALDDLEARGQLESRAITDHIGALSPRALRAAWRQFSGGAADARGVSTLNFDEFSALCTRLAAAQLGRGAAPLSTLELVGLFAQANLDGDGAIDFNEWCASLPHLDELLAARRQAAHENAAGVTPGSAQAAAGAGAEQAGAVEGGGRAALTPLKLSKKPEVLSST